MSAAIDNRVVSMEFDNAKFEKNVAESLATLKKLSTSLDNIDNVSTSGLDNISKSIKEMPFDKMADAIDEINYRFSFLGQVGQQVISGLASEVSGLILKITNGIESLSIGQISAGWGKYEEKTKAVATIMASTGDAIEEVNTSLERLMWFSDETSYDFTDMTNNIGKFTATGAKLEESMIAMQGISNWAAVSGQNASVASRAMYNLSQAMSLGTVKVQDWKSIELANMATLEFKETVLKRAADLGKLVEVATDEAGTAYYVLAEDVAAGTATLASAFSAESMRDTLKDEWFDKELLMDVLNIYGGFSNTLGELSDATGAYSSELLPILDQVADGTLKTADVYDMFSESLQEAGWQLEDLEYILGILNSSDEYNQLGRKAYEAAQEARTFSDAINAVKDAVSSSWMRVFEDLFGNYTEVKGFWTEIANQLIDIFAAPADALHDLLKEANTGISLGTDALHSMFTEANGVVSTVDGLLLSLSNGTVTMGETGFDYLLDTINSYVYGTETYWEDVTKAMNAAGVSTSELIATYGNLGAAIYDTKGIFDSVSDSITAATGQTYDELIRDLIAVGNKTKTSTDIYKEHKEALDKVNWSAEEFTAIIDELANDKFTMWIAKHKDLFGAMEENANTNLYEAIADEMREAGFGIDELIEKYGSLESAIRSVESLSWLWENKGSFTSIFEKLGFKKGENGLPNNVKAAIESTHTVEESMQAANQIAKEVAWGWWGEGDEMVKNLEEAGYNAEYMQELADRWVNSNIYDPNARLYYWPDDRFGAEMQADPDKVWKQTSEAVAETTNEVELLQNAVDSIDFYNINAKEFVQGGFINTLTSITNFVEAIKLGISEIAIPITSEDLRGVASRFYVISEYIRGVSEKSLEVGSTFRSIIEIVGRFARIVIDIGKGLATFITPAFQLLITAIRPITFIIRAIAAIGRSVDEVTGKVSPIYRILTSISSIISSIITYVSKGMDAFSAMFGGDNSFLEYIGGEKFKNAIATFASAIDIIPTTFESIAESVKNSENIEEAMTAIFGGLGIMVSGFINTLSQIDFTSILTTIGGVLMTVATSIAGFLISAITGIFAGMKLGFEKLKTIDFSKIFSSILQGITAAGGLLVVGLYTVGQKILEGVSNVFNWLYEKITNFSFKGLWDKFWNFLISTMTEFQNGLREKYEPAIQKISEMTGISVEKLHSILDPFYSAIVEFDFTELKKKIEDKWGEFAEIFEPITNALSKVKNFLANFSKVMATFIGNWKVLGFKKAVKLEAEHGTEGYMEIFQFIIDVGRSISEIKGKFVAKIDALAANLNKMITAFKTSKFYQSIVTFYNTAKQGISALAQQAWDWLIYQLTDATSGFRRFLSFAKDKLGEFVEYLEEHTWLWARIALVLSAARVEIEKLSLFILIRSYLALPGQVIKKIAGIKDTFVDAVEALASFAGTFGTAMLKLAAAIAILSFLDPEGLKRGLWAVIAIIIVLGAFTLLLAKITSKGSGIELSLKDKKLTSDLDTFNYVGLGVAIVALAVGVRIIAGAVKKLGNLNENEFATGIERLRSIVLMLIKFLGVIFVASKSLSISGGSGKLFKNLSIGSSNLKGVGTALIGMAIALYIVVGAIKKIVDMDLTDRDLSVFKSVFNKIMLVMSVIAFASGKGNFKISTGIGLIALAVALRVAVNAIKAIKEIDLQEGDLRKITLIGLIITGMMSALSLASGLGKFKLGNALGLIAMVVAIRLMVNVIKAMSELFTDDEADLKIKKATMLFGAITVCMSVLAVAMGISSGGMMNLRPLVAFGAAIVAMYAVIGALKLLEGVKDISVGAIVALVVGMAAIVGAFWVVAATLEMFPGIKITDAVAGLILLAGISGAMLILAFALKQLDGVTIKFGTFMALVGGLGVAIIAFIVIVGLLNVFTAEVAIAEGLIAGLGLALLLVGGGLISIGEGVKDIGSGIKDLADGIIAFKDIDDADVESAMDKVKKIFEACGTAMDSILSEKNTGWFGKIINSYEETFGDVRGGLDNFFNDIQSLLDNISVLAGYNITTLTRGLLNMKLIFGSSSSAMNSVLTDKNTGWFGKIINSYEEVFSSVKGGLVAFFDKIDSLLSNMTKLAGYDQGTLRTALQNMRTIFSTSGTSMDAALTDDNTNIFGQVINSYEEVFGDVAGGDVEFFTKITSILDQMRMLAGEDIAPMIDSAFGNMVAVFGYSAEGLGVLSGGLENSGLSMCYNAYNDLFSSTSGGILSFFTDVASIRNQMSQIAHYPRHTLEDAMDNMLLIFGYAGESVQEVTEGNTFWGKLKVDFKDVIGGTGSGLASFFTEIASAMSSMLLVGVMDTETLGKAMDNMDTMFRASGDATSAAANGGDFANITAAFEAVKGSMTNFFDPKEGINSIAEEIKKFGETYTTDKIQTGLDAMNAVFDAAMWGTIKSSIGEWFNNKFAEGYDGTLLDAIDTFISIFSKTSTVTNAETGAQETVSAMTAVARGISELGNIDNAETAFENLNRLFGVDLYAFSGVDFDSDKIGKYAVNMTILANRLSSVRNALDGLIDLKIRDDGINRIQEAYAVLNELYGKDSVLYELAASDLDLSTIEGFGSSLQKGFDGITDAIKDYASEFKKELLKLMKKGRTAIKSEDEKRSWKSVGNDLVKKLSEGITSYSETLNGDLKEVLGNAWMVAYSTYDAWVKIGEYISLGLATGILNQGSTVQKAIYTICSGAEEEAMKTIKAASPSRVFMRIGEYVSQGMAIGILNDEDTVVSAAETMASSAISAATTAETLISQILESSENQPTIRPVLDLSEVQQQAQSIGSILGTTTLSTGSLASKASSLSTSIDMAKAKIQNAQMTNATVSLDANSLQAILANSNKPIQVNTNIAYEGSLAQLATVLHPYIKAESNRIGPSFVNSSRR